MTTWRIAWRNLWRNRRRTALALAAIGISVTLVLLYNSMLRGYGDWMVRTLTGPMLGHVQVHAPEWRATRAMDRTLTGAVRRAERIRREPGVSGADLRVYAPALAALGETGFVVIVVGVDLAAESQPDRLLSSVRDPLPARHVLIGSQLARQLGAKPGDVLALVGQGADGSVANDLVTVTADVTTSVDLINRQAVIMDLTEAQALFAMPDQAHEIVVYAQDPKSVDALTRDLRALPELDDAEVLDWRTIAPELVDLLEIVEVAWVFVLLLVFVAAAAGVANTMLMATFERMHEFGMLLALGTSPLRIVAMITIESLVLGLTGTLAGAAIGITIVALTHSHGVDYAALTGGGPSSLSFGGLNWSLRIFPSLAVIDVARVVVAVVITSLAASAWPALKAARLQPSRALRD
jgi:ABC-type lipoprotein release transport system permease subunit